MNMENTIVNLYGTTDTSCDDNVMFENDQLILIKFCNL